MINGRGAAGTEPRFSAALAASRGEALGSHIVLESLRMCLYARQGPSIGQPYRNPIGLAGRTLRSSGLSVKGPVNGRPRD